MMRYVQVLLFLATALWSAPSAWAQYGLYGSPALLDLSTQPAPAFVPSSHAASDAWNESADGSLDPCAYVQGRKRGSVADVPPAPGHEPAAGRPASSSPSVVEQMLAEADAPAASEVSGASAEGVWAGYGTSAPGPVAADCCDPCVACCPMNWYATVRGLVMSRNDANHVWVSYENGVNENQLMNTEMSLDWKGGIEARLGRQFCCGQWALEATYWTLDGFSGFSSVRPAAGVSSPLMFFDVAEAEGFFDGAVEHRLWRDNEVHNVELNLIRNALGYGGYDAFDARWLVGIRFFRFDEDLIFGSLGAGGVAFGDDPSVEGYFADGVENNLVGAQFGLDLGYRRGNWRLFAAPKVGIYNNHIKHYFAGYSGDGQLFTVTAEGYPPYPVVSSTDVVSFLTEIDVGLQWRFAPRWSAEIGYRVTVATAMALADHQIPPYVVDTPELADIDTNGHLLLHGGFAGLTFWF